MDMICVEGFKAFRGTMKIIPEVPGIAPFTITGGWLYKPDTDCWYCNGQSYPASVCKPVETK